MSAPDRPAAESGGRSAIDATTNIAHLTPVHLERDAGALLTGRLTRTALPVYLHEATHHLCFFSPVGLALALLNLRARRRARLLELQPEPDVFETPELDAFGVLDDYVRHDVLTRALAPLAEGLACFAEFDAVSTASSPVATDVMTSLAGHFIRPERADADLWETLASTLLVERSSHFYANRKTSLLTQSMDPSDGGYLVGYLFVTRLWRHAASVDPRLNDSDLFLDLLVTYVYSDLGLVAHLLDSQTCDAGAAQAIVNYLTGRLRTFVESLSLAWVDALEAQSSRPFLDEQADGDLTSRISEIPALGTEPALVEAGRQRLAALYAELDGEARDDDGPLGLLPRRQLWSIAERQLLLIGSLEVELDVNQHEFVRVWRGGRLLTSGPGVAGARERARTRGSLAIHVNPWHWGRFMAYTASCDGNPLLVWFNRDLAPAIRDQFLGFMIDPELATMLDREQAEHVEAHVQRDETAQIVLGAVRDELVRWSGLIYPVLALPGVPTDALEAAVERTSPDGLLPVLGSLPRVRALAWLSLNWMLYEDDESLAEAFRQAEAFHVAGLDLWTVVEEIATRAQAALGEPLVARVDGRLVCSV